MNAALYVIPAVAAAVTWLIWAEFTNHSRHIYIVKPVATILVIFIAGLSLFGLDYNPTYTAGILIGLLFSLGGDIALMFQANRRAFMVGLVLFLLAHIIYTAVFVILGQFSSWDLVSGVLLLIVGVGIYRVLKPGLGAMNGPVIGYILIISLMVNRAWAVFTSPNFSHTQAWMIAAGALLFYVSDVMLAANRFWRPWRYHRISLAFYYSGQMLIALAASYF